MGIFETIHHGIRGLGQSGFSLVSKLLIRVKGELQVAMRIDRGLGKQWRGRVLHDTRLFALHSS